MAVSRSTTQDSPTNPNNGSTLWKHGDESFYNPEREGSLRSAESGSSRWHYPANFNDTLPGAEDGAGRKKKKKKKDRWARTEDAYTAPEQKKRKKKSKNRSTVGDGGDIESTYSRSTADLEVPEDAAGGVYGSERQRDGNAAGEGGHAAALQGEGDDVFNHEF